MMWVKKKNNTLEYPQGVEKEVSKKDIVVKICQWIGVLVWVLLIVFAPQIQSLYMTSMPVDMSTVEAIENNCYSAVIYIEDKGYALNDVCELHGIRSLLEGFKRGRRVFFCGGKIFEKAKSDGVWGTCYDREFNETCQYALYNDKVYLLVDGVYYKGTMVSSKHVFKESLKHIKDGTTYEWLKRILERSAQK